MSSLPVAIDAFSKVAERRELFSDFKFLVGSLCYLSVWEGGVGCVKGEVCVVYFKHVCCFSPKATNLICSR